MKDQSGLTMTCPTCNGVMDSMQTMDGAFFVCGECKDEIPVIDIETVTE